MIIGHKYITHSLEELDTFVKKEFLPFIEASDADATVYALSGDLGSGKTAFVKSVATQMGINEQIASPTFIIAKFYPLPRMDSPDEVLESPQEERAHLHFHELVHIDAYRMENEDEAEVLRLSEILNDGKKIIFIEWPEKLGKHLPLGARKIEFKFIDENSREISALN